MNGDDFLTCLGGEVKSLGRGRVAGRVVTFSSAADPDRVRDYFDQDSEFWLSTGDKKPILFRHGQDSSVKQRRFGEVSLTLAADGVWAEGTINGADTQAQKLRDLVEAGGMGWSTGSVSHLVTKSPRGDSFHVDLWPISECSLAPRDYICEPRNVAALKELIVAQDFDSLVVPPSPAQQAAEIYAQILIRAIEAQTRSLGLNA